MTKQNLALRSVFFGCLAICQIQAQSVRPKPTDNPSQSGLEATWKRIDIEEVSGRAEKKVHLAASWVDASKAYFIGTFKGKPFTLKCLLSSKIGHPNNLILTIGDQSQVLGPVTQTWRLSWAGDSDGDGKLDFVISMVGDGGRDSSSSFLSALAKPGDLVGLAPYVSNEDDDEDEGC